MKGRALQESLLGVPAPETATMTSNVYELRPPAASVAVEQVEPVEAAMRELSARITADTVRLRRGYSRAHELGSRIPSLRRKRERPTPPAMDAPVTFFSIEEAAAADAAAPLRVASGGR
jgi:hypothetical protein